MRVEEIFALLVENKQSGACFTALCVFHEAWKPVEACVLDDDKIASA
jgi:hypothetical protein